MPVDSPDLFDAPRAISPPDAELVLYPGFDPGNDPYDLLRELIQQTPWRADAITLFGKRHPQPRLHAWYGDAGCAYRYSGLRLEPLPWTPTLERLRRQVEQAAGGEFNSVLLNYYRHERDSMGMHADDEPELGPRPLIASLSLGATRTLLLRHRTRHDLKTLRLPLPHGSLLVMGGETQQHWKHGINKERRPLGPRVNLTFRKILR